MHNQDSILSRRQAVKAGIAGSIVSTTGCMSSGPSQSGEDSTLPITDDFSSVWNLYGDASIAEIDGINTLRLTEADGGQVGAGIYTNSLSTTQEFTVEFHYYVDEGSGGDGFALLLLNESQVAVDGFSVGEEGGSLAYTGNPGITGGYLAVGFDEFGNFSATNPDRSDGPGKNPQSITVRGAGDEAEGSSDDAYPHLVTESPSGEIDGGWRWARVTADPVSGTKSLALHIEMSYDDRDSWETIIDDEFSTEDIGGGIPEEFLLGFSGATAGSTNIHAIDSVSVSESS